MDAVFISFLITTMWPHSEGGDIPVQSSSIVPHKNVVLRNESRMFAPAHSNGGLVRPSSTFASGRSLLSLENYKSTVETKSCYLDGRYIAVVLQDVREFHKEPITISAQFDKNFELVSANIRAAVTLHDGMNIIRVVIVTPMMSHSALLWIDKREGTITFSDVRTHGADKEYREAVDKVVKELLRDLFKHLKYTFSMDVAYVPEPTKLTGCAKFGYCNAYVIKQVLDYLDNKNFDPSDIRRFAATVEREYGHLLDSRTAPEEEYYIGGLGLGLGLLGGVAIGSAIASSSRPRYVYAQPQSGYGYGGGGYPAYSYGYPAYY